MKKYYIEDWSVDIKEFEIIKESEHSVWFTEKIHERKETAYHNYCGTWEEAYDLLLNRVTRNRDSLQSQLTSAQLKYEKVLALKKP